MPSGPINRINLSQGGATLSRDQHRHGQRDLHIENQFPISIEQGQVFVVGCPMMWGTRDGMSGFMGGLDSRAGHSANSQSRPVFEMIGAELYYYLLHLQTFSSVTSFSSFYFSYLVFSPAIFYLLICILPFSFAIFFSRIGLFFLLISLFSVSLFIVVISCFKNRLSPLYDGQLFHFHQSLSLYCPRSFGTCANCSTTHDLFCYLNNL